MRRCIYCLEDKALTAFNGREHVIPQAFGLFEGNLVLKCVCDDCNTIFGNSIDLKIARDSVEGIDRISAGLKPASEYKSLGAKSTTGFEFKEGPLAGGFGHYEANPDGDELRVVASPQVWFGKSAAGPYDRFRINELPTKDELIARGYEGGSTLWLRTEGIDPEKARPLLEAKGFDMSHFPEGTETPPPNGRVLGETVARISHPEFRLATKIALNYLAAVVGSDVALRPEFDRARAYARYGEERGRVPVHCFENRWFVGRTGHYVSLSQAKDLVVVQLSLLLRVQYVVTLAVDAEQVPVVSSAHFFDLSAHKVTEIEPLELRFGRELNSIRL
jgi:hypothetical protein